MSFRCEVCKTPQPPRSTLHKLVTEIRTVSYEPQQATERGFAPHRFKKPSLGSEIVKEISACERCFTKLRRKEPTVVNSIAIEYEYEQPPKKNKRQNNNEDDD